MFSSSVTAASVKPATKQVPPKHTNYTFSSFFLCVFLNCAVQYQILVSLRPANTSDFEMSGLGQI